MATWHTHFGLEQAPFSKEVVDDDLWLPPSKQALVDTLTEAVSDHQSVLVTGDPGVGKTCVLRALRRQLPQAGFRLTYCHNATLGRRDFYRQICLSLGLAPKATASAVFYAVSTHVQELGRDRVHPVFLLDEAHLLNQDVLDHLHILLNYEWDSAALLSLVLVGLPELNERLAMRRNRSLYSRLHQRLHIDALTPEDTAHYIRRRLDHVGCDRQLFTKDAVAMLHEAANGTMRGVDRIATAALRSSARAGKQLVERDYLMAAVEADVPSYAASL